MSDWQPNIKWERATTLPSGVQVEQRTDARGKTFYVNVNDNTIMNTLPRLRRTPSKATEDMPEEQKRFLNAILENDIETVTSFCHDVSLVGPGGPVDLNHYYHYRKKKEPRFSFGSSGELDVQTAIYRAAALGYTEIVNVLRSVDTLDVNKGNMITRATPLFVAADRGNKGVVELLSSDPRVNVNSTDTHGSSPLSKAVAGKYEVTKDVIRVLCKNNRVDVHHRDWEGSDKQDRLFTEPGCYPLVVRLELQKSGVPDIKKHNQYGDTLVHMAVLSDNKEALEFLSVQEGANLNRRNKEGGYTPLCFAAEKGYGEISEYLCTRGKVELNEPTDEGCTPLLLAAQNGHINVVTYLTTLDGIDMDRGNNHEDTPFLCAAKNGHLETVKHLCQFDTIDKNRVNKRGNTPLLAAAEEGCTDIVKYLCQFDTVDKNHANERGYNALLYAAEKGDADLVKHLWQFDTVDKNHFDIKGNTALHVAVLNRHIEIIHYLCEHDKIDFMAKNHEGKTALDVIFPADGQIEERLYPTVVKIACKTPDKAVTSRQDKRGNTILHMAVNCEHEDALNALVCLSRFPEAKNIKNNSKATPFYLVTQSEDHPLSFLLYLYNLPGADWDDINKRYRSENLTLLHIAAKENQHDIVKALLDGNADIDTNTVDENGKTALHYAVDNNKLDSVKLLCSHTKTDINFVHGGTGKSPMSIAVEKNHNDIVMFLLTQPSVNINIHDEQSKGVFQVLRTIIKEKKSRLESEDKDTETYDHILSTYLTDVSTDMPNILKKMLENEKKPVLEYLYKIKDDKSSGDDLRTISAALLNVIITGLKMYADHKRLRYVFSKSSVFKTLVHIFVNLDEGSISDESYFKQLLNLLYISLQANIKCDCMNADKTQNTPDHSNVGSKEDIPFLVEVDGVTSNNENAAIVKALCTLLGEELFKTFSERITKVSQFEKNAVVSEAQLIARNIHKTYFKEDKGCCSSVKKCFVKAGECLSSCLCLSRFSHKCIVRGYFAFLPCFVAIIGHLSDYGTDAAVGYKHINGFSERLGISMMVLVVVTVVHENIHSSSSAYVTETELLRTILGKIDLTPADWETSDLNYHNYDWKVLKYLGRFFWPYKVWGRSSIAVSVRAILFNFLSILWFRQVVDRLIVLTHSPSNLRVIYRQQSKEKSLNQYYMIMEQIPELLIQFYIFQIYFNILRTDEDYKISGCTELHSFKYNPDDFQCFQNLWKLKICASWWEIYSMIVPFVKIPNSMVSLEEIFRKLNAGTPTMSVAASWLLYLAYVLMIPSRIFLFAAVMHSASDHLHVIGYLGFWSLVWLVINGVFTKRARNRLRLQKAVGSAKGQESTIWKIIVNLWELLLFSIRDVFIISLRQPIAYLLSPSEVTYHTLRTWKEMLAISSYFFIEGVIGAVYVEYNYPCGMNTAVLKYQGWLYLILLIVSITLITLLSYVLQPEKIDIIPLRFPKSSIIICGYGLLMWFVAVATFLTTRAHDIMKVRVSVIIAPLIFATIFLAAVMILRCFGEAKLKKKDNEKKEPASHLVQLVNCNSTTNPDGIPLSTLSGQESVQISAPEQRWDSDTETRTEPERNPLLWDTETRTETGRNPLLWDTETRTETGRNPLLSIKEDEGSVSNQMETDTETRSKDLELRIEIETENSTSPVLIESEDSKGDVFKSEQRSEDIAPLVEPR